MANTVPVFIDNDVNQIASEIKASWELAIGKPIQPGQPEMFIVNTLAYRESLLRSSIQSACLQMLVNFAAGPTLDYLGELVGVTRLAALPAQTTLRFNLVDGHSSVTIVAGTRVQSTDGIIIFETDTDQTISIGVDTIDILATASTAGIIGNGYLAGDINVQLDPYAYVSDVANLATTAAGSDQETDDELRERIKIAPDSFSVAGPTNAYIFFAKSVSPDIIDVKAKSIKAGQMNIYVLVAGGIDTPPELIDAVDAALNPEDIRPTCDTVVVLSPTKIEYSLTVELTKITGASDIDLINQVTAILTTFTQEKQNKLGRDVIDKQIEALCMITGVYDLDLPGFTNIVVDDTSYAFCTSIDVTVVGENEG